MIEKKKHPLITVKEEFEKKQNQHFPFFSPISPENIIKEQEIPKSIKKMGLLILAGGMGTRLGYHGPKGCFELPFKHKKSLFEIHFQKIAQKGKNLSIAIMTSPLNHEKTVVYFKKKRWFGLKREQIDFFKQELVFMCDAQGNLFFDKPNQWAKSPDGNGKAFYYLMRSLIFNKWKAKGITYIQVIPVDNVLADPFDEKLTSLHEKTKSDLILTCIERIDPEEKVGILGIDRKQLKVMEYNEGDPRIKTTCHLDGRLVYSLAYIGLFSCSVAFIERIRDKLDLLPWHLVKKEAKRVFLSSGKWKNKYTLVYKFETFIFDLFSYAKSFHILLKKREECFAPLKNRSGSDSPELVAKKLENTHSELDLYEKT